MKISFSKWRKKNERRCKETEGFTFVETIAVLAIGALLATGASVSVNKVMELARHHSAEQTIAQYKAALQSYYLDCGTYPTSQQGLEALWQKPHLFPVPAAWNGPYVDRQISADPWGNYFIYAKNGSTAFSSSCPEGLPYSIISYGADGVAGGTGNNEDICSWK